MFVGRDEELAFLESQYKAPKSALIPVYGRRRVGKTELLRKFLGKRPGLFHVGKVAPASMLIRELLRQVAELLDDPVLADLPADGWRRPLELLGRYRGDRKLIIILDELQWSAAASPELQSLLQELWDHHWRDSGKMCLILCGSYVGFMEREVLGRKAPLFGRRTGQILLKPFSYHEAAAFHPNWSLRHRAEAHFICGGVPAYLKCFEEGRSIESNLQRVLLHELGVLRREPPFLLREELREIERYHGILFAIADGAYSAREIARRAGIEPHASVHYYLEQLIGLGYIERHYPLSNQKAVKRGVRYIIADALLRFWFRFVFPNESYLQAAGPARAFADRIRPQLPAFFGHCFERLCREALARLYVHKQVSTSWKIGSYWNKEMQIDVVGMREDGWTDLGECKWGTVRSAQKIARELQQKREHFPNQRGDSIAMHAFVRKRPSGKTPGMRWHDLEAIYGW